MKNKRSTSISSQPKTNNAQRLAGKYYDWIPENLRDVDYSEAREAAMFDAFKTKHLREASRLKALQMLDELDAMGF